jgi:flavin reductase (DIM6/NTAB) family NADH-FMN oxidoreductase RutF
VSLNPPLVLWSPGSFSGHERIQDASHFAVNVLGLCSKRLRANRKIFEDKFAEFTDNNWQRAILADSVANFQCRAANRYYGGDHVIFLGAVEAYAYNRREPLLFAHSSYGRFLAADDTLPTPKP